MLEIDGAKVLVNAYYRGTEKLGVVVNRDSRRCSDEGEGFWPKR